MNYEQILAIAITCSAMAVTFLVGAYQEQRARGTLALARGKVKPLGV
jgi:hypothetical protein